MKNANTRFIPWTITIILVVAFIFNFISMSKQVSQGKNDLLVLSNKYDLLVANTNLKLQQAKLQNEKLVLESNQKLKEASLLNEDLAIDANEKIRIAQQPEIDVKVNFRKALISNGSVARLTNISGNSIAVKAEIIRPSTNVVREYEFTLDPNVTIEIGELEGWAFVSGDKITVHQAEHKSLSFILP